MYTVLVKVKCINFSFYSC